MANQAVKPGDSEIENLRYLARYLAAGDSLLNCKALLALVTPDGMAVESTQAARLLKEALTTVARRDAERGVMLAQAALKSGEIVPKSERFPCAAAGELLGLLDSQLSIRVALARKFPPRVIDSLTRKDESDSKRERQARASVWMAAGNVKRYTGKVESELLTILLDALRDLVMGEEFRNRTAMFLADVVDGKSTRPIPQMPVMLSVPPSAEENSSPGWKRWVWPAAISVVLVLAVVVGIAVYNKARSADSCAPSDASCLPFSILVETDLDRIAPGVPVGAYLFKPGAFAAAPKKPSCADGYRTQEWARQHGGVPAGLQYVRVSITAKDKPILLNFAEVEANYMANHRGDVATCLDGTQLDVRQLEVDTDRETTTYYSHFDTQRGLVAEPLALHIAPGEAEVIVVSARATTKDVLWHLKLGMDVAGEHVEHLVFDKNNKDFQLAASEAADRTMYRESAPYHWEVLDS